MRKRLHDRLLYIVCSQNWDAIGSHYWIKQAIELLLVTATSGNYSKLVYNLIARTQPNNQVVSLFLEMNLQNEIIH